MNLLTPINISILLPWKLTSRLLFTCDVFQLLFQMYILYLLIEAVMCLFDLAGHKTMLCRPEKPPCGEQRMSKLLSERLYV